MNTPQLFESIFKAQSIELTPLKFMLCLGSALLMGIILAFAYSFRIRRSASFAIALAMLPAAVCAVIIAVSGNIGAGVAVAGAFGLVRFRSAPGGAREICAIFIAMGTGLICGMGLLAYAAMFTVLMGLFFMLYNSVSQRASARGKTLVLNITVPEDINYTDAFNSVFEEYTKSCRLQSAKTFAMGSMYRLKYEVNMKSGVNEKDFIDALRCRNGNLEISLSLPEGDGNEL